MPWLPPVRAGRPESRRQLFARRCRGRDDLEILDRAVNKAIAAVLARHGRHERVGAGREHQLVVRHLAVARRAHHFALRVDGEHAVVQPQGHRVLLEEAFRHDVEVGCRLAGEETRELHAVVGRPGLFAKRRYFEVIAARDQLLEEALPYHAIADHHHIFVCACSENSGCPPQAGLPVLLPRQADDRSDED